MKSFGARPIGLQRLTDELTLKRDGRRVSLEGVLTGGALGLVLLYMFQEAAQAGQASRARGPVSLKGPSDLGEFQGGGGRIRIRPLEEGELDLSGRRPNAPLGPQGDLPPGSVGRPELARRKQPDETGESSAVPFGASLPPPVLGPGGSSGSSSPSQPQPVTPQPEPPGPQPPGPAPPGPVPPRPPDPPDPLPQLVLVIVQGESSAMARSLYGTAASKINARQVDIANSNIEYRSGLPVAGEAISNRIVPASATSRFNDASLELDLEHISLLDTMIRAGNATDLLVYRVDELLDLGLLASGRTSASVASRSAVLDNTNITTKAGDDRIALEALMNLRFHGLGESSQTDLVFRLLTQGLKDSFLSLGSGANTVTVNSGFYRSHQGVALGDVLGLGLDFDFPNRKDLPSGSDWSFNLNAKAIGLDKSNLLFGGEDDELTVFTAIDQDLGRQLGDRMLDPNTNIRLQQIGLLDSSVDMGGGNDRVRINGAIINSVIDLGDGNNSLILEQALRDGSRIEMGDGVNTVQVSKMLGGVVEGGNGDNRFLFDDLILAGELNGGEGFNTLTATGKSASAPLSDIRDVVALSGPDQGFFNGMRFRSIQEIDTGLGDDVVIMTLNGSLTGRLLGGDGLNRLEFSSWDLPVIVDLDAGLATGIFGGRNGGLSAFQSAVGSKANDTLAASGRFKSLSGGGGSDTFLLRWSPWESPTDTGLTLGLNPLSDQVVLSGLEQNLPEAWDRRFGLPVISSLDLSQSPGVTDQILWQRDSGVLELTPSGTEGLGDATRLPIAPLDQLLSGMVDSTPQLAVNTSPLLAPGGGAAELILLGSSGSELFHTVAKLPGATFGVHDPRGGSKI